MNRYVLSVSSRTNAAGLAASYFKLKTADKAVRRLPWLQGIRFAPQPPEPVCLYVETDDDYADAFADYVPVGIPLVSDRLKEVLQSVGVANIEYFRTLVRDPTLFPELPTYWAINVVGNVSVADSAQSRGERAFGIEGATLFDKFVQRPNLDSEPRVFRAAESASTLVVDSAVKLACESANIDTLRFVPLNEWFA